eukprot:GHVS01072020.1.p1 GENE.GHVS01072020.1~~GHVS01072020.1.p1  ORF type:complete len:173 (+),score=34.44 GHVS01072020.1:209-727(+)
MISHFGKGKEWREAAAEAGTHIGGRKRSRRSSRSSSGHYPMVSDSPSSCTYSTSSSGAGGADGSYDRIKVVVAGCSGNGATSSSTTGDSIGGNIGAGKGKRKASVFLTATAAEHQKKLMRPLNISVDDIMNWLSCRTDMPDSPLWFRQSFVRMVSAQAAAAQRMPHPTNNDR